MSSPWCWAGNCACLFIPLYKTIRESHLPWHFSLLNVLFRARECYGCTRDLCWEYLKSVSNKCVQQTDNSYSMSRFVYNYFYRESYHNMYLCNVKIFVVIEEVSAQGIFQQFWFKHHIKFHVEILICNIKNHKKNNKRDCDWILEKPFVKNSVDGRKSSKFIYCAMTTFYTVLYYCFSSFLQAYSTVEIVYITW